MGNTRAPVQTLENLEMKKTLVALAALAATSAFAQSTVAITGIVNYGAHHDANGVTSYGGLKGDRNKLNFAATEDMGGGTKAIAVLETRFNLANGSQGYANTAATPDTAKGTTLFEQTVVGLTDQTLGTVKFGRFTNVIGTYDFSVFEDSKYGTNASIASYGRLSGQAQYDSPKFAGITASVVTASKTQNKYGAAYGWGPVDSIDWSANSKTGYRDFNAIALTYANGPVNAQLSRIVGLYNDTNNKFGISYDAGVAKAYYGYYKQNGNVGEVAASTAAAATSAGQWGAIATTIAADTSGKANGVAAHTAQEVGAYVPYGKFGFRAGYVRNNQDVAVGVTDGSTKATKTTLGAEYSFSKRTMAIAQHSKVGNGVPTGNGSLGGGFGYTTGTASFLGLQHSF
jgi:predicted porin